MAVSKLNVMLHMKGQHLHFFPKPPHHLKRLHLVALVLIITSIIQLRELSNA